MKYGFTCGAFDLFHAGHALMLKEAKEQCDILIVGLHADPHEERPEKNVPVQSVEERRIILESCKYITKIIEYRTEQDLINILKKLKSQQECDLRIVGEDYLGKRFTGDDLGIPIYYNTRKHLYSSSELRKRIRGEK